MNSSAVITVKGLSKAYKLYKQPSDMLKELLMGKNCHDVFWALRDVNLVINEGEKIGIIGPNGAGKSTLLKILTGNLDSTTGDVQVRGKISSMLSLTSFLDEDETGLENIRLNLLLNGANEKEIPRLVEEIVDFTELGEFIHSPVKTYSSGMNARLAFAISTSATPDILVVDEVLGVGDGYFVGKATQRMRELCDRGRALLYVSHSTSAIQMLCDRVVWIDGGTIRMDGTAKDVLRAYEEDFRKCEDLAIRSGHNEQKERRQLPLENIVNPEEYWVMRIVAKNKEYFKETHFVSGILVQIEGVDDFSVPLDHREELPDDGQINLDIFGSEWGRIYEHQGETCRLLQKTTGRSSGGIMMHKIPDGFVGNNYDIDMTLRSFQHGEERLKIQFLDRELGAWVDCKVDFESIEDGSWKSQKFTTTVRKFDENKVSQAKEKLRLADMPSVDVKSVRVICNECETDTVPEKEPFSIVVSAEVIRETKCVDFGVRLIKSDGAFSFWQSSGQSMGNVDLEKGCVEVEFVFDANHFCSGDYMISISASNGWDPKNNYPYSCVYSRKINVGQITITREYSEIDFGAVNQVVSTELRYVK